MAKPSYDVQSKQQAEQNWQPSILCLPLTPKDLVKIPKKLSKMMGRAPACDYEDQLQQKRLSLFEHANSFLAQILYKLAIQFIILLISNLR